ncbi:P-loop containing nucleoside triphosphate hydrolase protein [Gamsiella multidivaricata]|uniref:P-loop containing nucleoside triphosphate hydrolase protein n=1 Tax=Gamsiella multidivaricata TaxID=101098 RepID=UPI002220F510|nr:P-loop containing nucleoside triphosphate hydrolase protein [Gamsiella multidivaricata]KAG0356653.1 hypothetical protein BGZ54_000664 [Gamsiella multidivaricata]KAI7827603.1 P-loop containing nucleoside triphosphate hydrolase protein [Gamsiella multidivaricata]
MASNIDHVKQQPLLIVAMGVSGTGKSTLGQGLADAINMPFIDGDQLHSKASIAKMASGHPLTDEDREPWLNLIRTKAEQVCAEQRLDSSSKAIRPGVVVACSALKKYYRDILRGKRESNDPSQQTNPDATKPDALSTCFVFLKGDKDVILERMQRRTGHYMKANMLDSQLATLESPEGEDGVVVIRIEDQPAEQVRKAREGLCRLVGPV